MLDAFDRLQRGAVAVEREHPGAFVAEAFGGGAADALRRSGHHRGLARQSHSISCASLCVGSVLLVKVAFVKSRDMVRR